MVKPITGLSAAERRPRREETKQRTFLVIDDPGCFQFCGRKNRSGGVWYMGLDKFGQAHFSCYWDRLLLFNVFKIRVKRRKKRAAACRELKRRLRGGA